MKHRSISVTAIIKTAVVFTLAVVIWWSKPSPLSASWFQTVTGHVHSNSAIDMNVPGSSSEYVSIEGFAPGLLTGDSGLITHDDGSPDVSLGSETPALGGGSGTDWVVQSGAFPRDGAQYGFDYYNTLFANKTDLSDAPNLIQGSCRQGPPGAPPGVYYRSGDLTIDCGGGLTLPAGAYVFLIEGDLRIESRINLAGDSDFVAFIVGGDIIIRDSADGGSVTNPDIQGLYIADGQIDVRDDNEPIFFEGIFVAWDDTGTGRGFRLRRDAGASEVAETFIFRPELILYLPDEMKEKNTSWEEVAP